MPANSPEHMQDSIGHAIRLPSLTILLTMTMVAIGCGGGDSSTAAPVAAPAEPAALTGVTAAHNQVRAKVGVAPLVWNTALAATAQAWADAGTDSQAPAGLLDHNPNRSNGFSYAVGENIFGSSGAITGPEAVAIWAAEADHYDQHERSRLQPLHASRVGSQS